MDPRLVLKEFAERSSRPKLDITKWLFREQIRFLRDKQKYKAVLCTRRAGKSYLAGSMLYRAANRFPGSTSLYVGLTRSSAENIMWPILRELNEKHAIGAVLKDSELKVVLPNNSIIWLVGADMKNFIPRLLGGKYPLGIIDEAQNFRQHIEELVDDILTPATLDYNGEICLFGTPGPIPSGYYFDVTEKKMHGFSLHKWSLFDNPHLTDPRGFVDNLIKRKNWSEDNPTLLRQYMGKWVQDYDALVYRFRDEKNEFDEVPENTNLYRILSLDIGFNDATAMGIVSYSDHSPNIWIEHAEGKSGMIPSEIAERMKQLVEKFQPVKIVADTGGLGKSIVEEMKRRWGLPIVAAEKREKLTNIRLMNGDFESGFIKVHRSLDNLKNQYKVLVKDDKGLEEPSLPNDLCDMALYGYREARAYAHSQEFNPSPEELVKQVEKKMWDEDEEALLSSEREPWWAR